jgi:hypothetical protein
VWRLFTFIEERLEDFVCLSDVDGVNTNTFIVRGQSLKRFATVVGTT